MTAANLVGEAERVYALDISRRALDRMEKKAKQEGLKNIVQVGVSREGEIRIEDEIILLKSFHFINSSLIL